MKSKILRIFSAIILLLSILLFLYVGFCDFELLKIKGNSKENFYPCLVFSIASYFAVLFILIYFKKYNLVSFLHLLWLIPVLILFFNMMYGSNNIRKIDYLIGIKQKKSEVTEYRYKTEQIKRIVIGQDTLLYSPLPCCDNEEFTLEEIKGANISKSWITGYYYISISKKSIKISENLQ